MLVLTSLTVCVQEEQQAKRWMCCVSLHVTWDNHHHGLPVEFTIDSEIGRRGPNNTRGLGEPRADG